MNSVASDFAPEFLAVAQTGPRLNLRVLAGRSEGAEHSLPHGRRVMIGHSYENDIVLRSPQSRGVALLLTPRDRLAVLEVVAGEAVVLGRSMGAGEKVMLEPYVPVRVGGFVFAIGEADDERWSAARELAAYDPSDTLQGCEAVPCTTLAERLDLRTQPLRSRYAGTLLSPKALGIAAAVMLAIAGGGLLGSVVLSPGATTRPDLQAELAEVNFRHLSVEPAANAAGLAIVGLVADEGELLRLREWAARTHPDVTLAVGTLASAAETASNLLAAQGVEARVRPRGADGLLVETAFLPVDRRSELEAMLKRDLNRVRQFTFTTSPDRGGSELAYFFNAPGYGAASFVAGDPGYVVTEDGTRWFAGARLPTGHTIVAIEDNAVTVERNGQRETLTM